jgi:hypothetical protein
VRLLITPALAIPPDTSAEWLCRVLIAALTLELLPCITDYFYGTICRDFNSTFFTRFFGTISFTLFFALFFHYILQKLLHPS